LLVDDNLAFAENVAEILRDNGDEATVAGDGADALELIRKQRYDAMLTDMKMPRMGGAELMRQLRTVDPGIPVIVATAYSGDEDLRIARQEGLLAVMPKPLDLARLTELFTKARRNGLIALVEDDEALSDNLCEALRSVGLSAITATSVVETERLGPISPFVGIVDLRVPGGPDGEALLRLKAKFPSLPMLVITAHASPQADIKALRVFGKPFATAELLAEVSRLYELQGSR
jgi:CheY-like chemotaxis protein